MLLQIAQNSTKMYSYYNNCTHCTNSNCGSQPRGKNGTNHGDSWIIITLATGTWVPLTRLFQDSSFHFIQNLIHFSFFQAGSREIWGFWTLESTHGILRFETGFIISWDWFHICQYWFCFCSHFWRTLNRFWTTKHVPENQSFVDL